MSQPSVYYWAPSNGDGFDDGIAKLQDVANGEDFVLVANTPGKPGVFSYINTLSSNPTSSKDVIRSINFTSANDNSGVHFRIKGIGTPVDSDGNPTGLIGPIEEDITTGLPADTVLTSTNIYTVIESITVISGDADAVYIGYGPTGITNYISIDTNRTFSQVLATIQFINQSDIQATCWASANKPESPNPYGNLTKFGVDSLPTDIFIPGFIQSGPNTSDSAFAVNVPFSVVWLNIQLVLAAEPEYDDSVYFTVLQQGTHS